VGHGRPETRVAQAVTWTSLAFPHVKQVARHRHRTDRATGKRTRETVHLITDPSASEVPPRCSGGTRGAILDLFGVPTDLRPC